jgi:hypothetical protein
MLQTQMSDTHPINRFEKRNTLLSHLWPEPHDPEQSRLLRQEYGKWQDSFEKRKADPAPLQHWIRFVLTKTLDLDDRVLAEGQAIPQTLHVEIPEHQEFLRPNIVVIDPNTKKPRLGDRRHHRRFERFPIPNKDQTAVIRNI